MSENRDTGGQGRNPGEPSAGREGWVRLLLVGRISCIIGLILGVGGVVAALMGVGAGITSAALGSALGVLGYFLGTRRLATTTVLVCVAALFFGLAASQGLIPGIEAAGRNLPADGPAA